MQINLNIRVYLRIVLSYNFSHRINRLRDAGILDYWHRRNWPWPNRCSEPLITKIDSYVTLNLNYFLSNFVLLGGGVLAALLVFSIEIIIGKICRK